MENTLYIKKETSDLPKDSGLYETNMGVLFFEYGNWYKKASDAYPIDMAPFEYWFDTVSTKVMTLDEAKDEVAKRNNCESWIGAGIQQQGVMFELICELYLQSNMAALVEQNEEYARILNETNERLDKSLSKVNVLKKALEEISLHTDMPDSPTEQLVNKIANQTLQSITK